jgi:hypothetical protein
MHCSDKGQHQEVRKSVRNYGRKEERKGFVLVLVVWLKYDRILAMHISSVLSCDLQPQRVAVPSIPF